MKLARPFAVFLMGKLRFLFVSLRQKYRRLIPSQCSLDNILPMDRRDCSPSSSPFKLNRWKDRKLHIAASAIAVISHRSRAVGYSSKVPLSSAPLFLPSIVPITGRLIRGGLVYLNVNYCEKSPVNKFGNLGLGVNQITWVTWSTRVTWDRRKVTCLWLS